MLGAIEAIERRDERLQIPRPLLSARADRDLVCHPDPDTRPDTTNAPTGPRRSQAGISCSMLGMLYPGVGLDGSFRAAVQHVKSRPTRPAIRSAHYAYSEAARQ